MFDSIRVMLACVVCATVLLFPPQAAATLPAGFAQSQMATGLTSPTSIHMLPDGRVLVAEQTGELRMIKDGVLLPTPVAVFDVHTYEERGLLGITSHPDFANNGWIYVYHTARLPTPHNRLSRFHLVGDLMASGTEQILADFQDIAAKVRWHMGGHLEFDEDGKLFLTVGIHEDNSTAQPLTTPLGKILRFNDDGSIPTDNPFYNQTTGLSRAIWARGLRNTFSFAIDNEHGLIVGHDVGSEEQGFEEVNSIIRGGNYGWPVHEGYSTEAGFQSPLYAYPHAGADACTIGGVFYPHEQTHFPAQYRGKYFFAEFVHGWIKSMDMHATVPRDTLTTFGTGLGNITGMTMAADGSIWYLLRGAGANGNLESGKGRVMRIYYTASSAPTVSVPPSDALASVGEDAQFTLEVDGVAPFSFQWQRNGVDIPGATNQILIVPAVVIGDNGAQFRCVVTNAFDSVISDPGTLSVTTNQRPTASIDSPVDGTLYSAGDTLTVTGSGLDAEDGALAAGSMTWRIDFHHASHVHPFRQEEAGVSSVTFSVPQDGHNDATNVWFRVYLTVEDSAGLRRTVFRDYHPRTVELTIHSNPPGLSFHINNLVHSTPFTFTTVVGVLHKIEVLGGQSQAGMDQRWFFNSWGDSADGALRFLEVPTTTDAYSIQFHQEHQVGGTGIGMPGFGTKSSATSPGKAFDGDIATFFKGAKSTGSWTGLWRGDVVRDRIVKIRYRPKAGAASSMRGGVFQSASDSAFVIGVREIAKITSTPKNNEWSEIILPTPVNPMAIRYLGPAGSFGQVAEIEFYTDAAP
ncbi:MAG: PQQ-dependent sugar dehydrogenase [Verrucomicrobiales bacterium]|nr:PQQ-dependent sugar dehydrogenase [Verrucomicrobiales bacterium]MCP5556185.1 PQQ-dependent sugar dehydrogenase [Verrucomicrobiaceae bacterium]